MKQLSILISFFLLFTTLSFSQGNYPSTLWEISKGGNSKPSYLFGTYHISNKGVFKLGDSIFVALKKVDMVAKEVNANTWQQEQFEMDKMELAYYSYNNRLREVSFSENTLNRTNTIQKLSAFMGFQPGFVNYYLYRNNANNEGFEEEMYLDKFISSAGYKYGKDIKGLENYLESNVLGIEGQKDQADLEKKERKKIPGGMSYREMQDKIYDGYLNNNLNAMDSFQIYEFESEAYFNKFVTKRNYNQADSIDYYIKTGKSIFAAVGAAHLPGKEGVIEILRKKGYTLRPVQLIYTNNNELEAVKKKIIPVTMSIQDIEGVIQLKAPGKMYPQDKSDIIKSYGYVDMMNSAYYFVSRLYNNAFYYNKNEQKTLKAIDSLLYSSVKGDIVSKKETSCNGYPCVDVTTKVKNKDVERYRFVVTPYEVLRFQVGGKNDYALSPFVDEFFNSIQLNLEKPLPTNYSFSLQNNMNLHQWTNTSNGYIQNKQRFTEYNKSNKQLNTLIKVVLPANAKNNDSLIQQLVRESVLNSEAFNEDDIDNFSIMPIGQKNQLHKLSLQSGGEMLIKTIIDFPNIYFLSSLSNNSPKEDFINSFQTKEFSYNTSYLLKDTTKKFSVKLPFEVSLDSEWKKQMDRTKKEYEDDKKPNAEKNLYYQPTSFGVKYTSSRMLFEDIEQMEVANLTHTILDDELYYPNAHSFWKKIVSRYENSRSSSSSGSLDFSSNFEDAVAAPSSRNRQSRSETSRIKIDNIQYDTTNKKVQKLSFTYYDSTSKKTNYYQYYLSDKNLHLVFFNYPNKTFSPLQKMILNSFEPITKNPISLYQSSFAKIVDDYKKSGKQKKPNVLDRLNNINSGLVNLQEIKAVYDKSAERNIDNNILRRKLIDMVAQGNYTDTEWSSVSQWLRSIYSNEKELSTLRNFAVQKIIDKEKVSDTDWLLQNFYNVSNAYQKKFSRSMNYYLRDVYPKNSIIPKVKLLLNEKNDFDKAMLIDSGYFSKAERLAAFQFYKTIVEDETLNIQLSQEKNDFLFNEKEINETLTNDNARTNFRPLLNGFKLFYNLNPTDKFFQTSYDKILNSKSNEDLMQLLEILLKQKNYEDSKINPIIEQLSSEPRKLYDINSLFFENNHYSKLPAKYKNKEKMAKYYLLSEQRYSKLDSIQLVGVEKYPFNSTDSVYFFKYIRDREVNANIAYIVLDNQNQYLKKLPYTNFTNEQITALEPYKKVVRKLMRRYYTETFFNGRNSFYLNNNYSKSLNSEE